jgi:hypothetical protein
MEVNGQFHALAALHRGKNFRYPLHRRLGEPESQSEVYGEVKNLFDLPGIEYRLLSCLVLSLVAIPTEPSRLLLSSKIFFIFNGIVRDTCMVY